MMKKLILLLLFALSGCSQPINYNIEKENFKETEGVIYYKWVMILTNKWKN